MKKGKVFGKGQVILALMVLALGAAVWLNMKLSSSTKYLGEAAYVSDSSAPSAVETAAKASGEEKTKDDTDYFTKAQKERTQALKTAKKDISEMLDTDNLTDADKEKIQKCVVDYTARVENSTNIENLIKAKGFEKAVAVINDDSVNIVVSAEGLTAAQTLQIQDIVTSQTGVDLAKIKIIAVK